MTTHGDPGPGSATETAAEATTGSARPPNETEEALQALEVAAAAIRTLHRGELADERPSADRWEREIAGVHRVLSAARNLMVAVGNSCPLYVVQARWRGGVKPAGADGSEPALELMEAGGKILVAHDKLHQPLMDLHLAQVRLGRLAFDHDQPSIWDDPNGG